MKLEVGLETFKDAQLLSATPVMAGRKLRDLPPETPFLASRQLGVDATPIIKTAFNRGGLRQMNVFGGLARNNPLLAAAPKEEVKNPFLPIPEFKKEKVMQPSFMSPRQDKKEPEVEAP